MERKNLKAVVGGGGVLKFSGGGGGGGGGGGTMHYDARVILSAFMCVVCV